MRKNGFSLIEVLVASAITLVMLVALIGLEIKSTAVAARASLGFDTLPVAIERVEELVEINFTGESRQVKEDYEVITTSSEEQVGLPVTRVHVEVYFDGKPYSELSIYKFQF
jgi:prepilin-type N-terminal cleavage/methylation domain-containing protein